MSLVTATDRRRTETPNAVMTTSASPSLGGSARLSLWWVEMTAGAAGPRHAFDSEQLWSVVAGKAAIDVGDDRLTLGPGDTAVLPAGVVRQIHALTDLRAVVCGDGHSRVTVPGEAADRGTPPWVA